MVMKSTSTSPRMSSPVPKPTTLPVPSISTSLPRTVLPSVVSSRYPVPLRFHLVGPRRLRLPPDQERHLPDPPGVPAAVLRRHQRPRQGQDHPVRQHRPSLHLQALPSLDRQAAHHLCPQPPHRHPSRLQLQGQGQGRRQGLGRGKERHWSRARRADGPH